MGKSLQNVDCIAFCVDTLIVKNGRKLGRVRPDENGYYNMPLAVLGTVTDNNTYYEVEEFVSQMTSPNTFFNRCLTDGKLYGEYGHPEIQMLEKDKQVPRLMMISEKCKSHHIKEVHTGEKLESGGRVLYGMIKPTGPFGDVLRQELDDPLMNTSFSLRSIAVSREEGAIIRRRIKHLVTFDYCNAGGYNEAAKRYAPASESLTIEISRAASPVTTAVMECLTDTEINEIFGSKTVMIGTKRTTFDSKDAALRDSDGQMRSVFTSLLGTL